MADTGRSMPFERQGNARRQDDENHGFGANVGGDLGFATDSG
jgi:hypothetical protein